jgi:hypothetical protein
MQVNRIRGSGYLQSTGADPCVLVRGRDGGFLVDVCNDSPFGADFGVELTTTVTRYKLGVSTTTVSVRGNECITVGPINVRLEGDIVPTGDFIRATLTDQATFAVIDELDERCQESPPPRQQPLGSGQSGTSGSSGCTSTFDCWAVSLNLTMPQLAFLMWLGGVLLLVAIVLIAIFLFGSCASVAVAKKAL